MKTLTRTDIRRACGNTYYNRGASYQHHGAVLELQVLRETEVDATFTARTRGNGGRVYQQDVSLFDYGNRVVVKGQCSCPMYSNCKHVVAACIEFSEMQKTGATGEQQVFQWLEDLEQSSLKNQLRSASQAGEFLAFVLTPGSASGLLDVDYKVVRYLKKGGLGKPRQARAYNLGSAYGAPAYVTSVDREIVRLIEVSNPLQWGNPALQGTAGGMALKLMAETGRCFWHKVDEDSRLSWHNETRRLQLAWKPHEQAGFSLDMKLDGGGELVDVEPPAFLDIVKGQVGWVDGGGFSAAQIRQLLTAPCLSEEAAHRLSRELLLHHPDLALPPPVELIVREIRDVSPRLLLTLFHDPAAYHMVALRFDYDGIAIQPLPVQEQSVLDTEAGLFTVHRCLSDEKQALERLENFGFAWLASDTEQELNGYMPADSLSESVDRWKGFLETGVPALEAEGWTIVMDDSFHMAFHEPGQWWGELEEEDNGWFSMSLEVELEGKRLPLLPLLAPLLEAYEPDELPETLHIPLGEHQYLSVPGHKLRPWLETLIELFDRQPPQDDDIRLSRFDAARLADMEAGDGELIWQGGEHLRELGRRLRDFKRLEEVPLPDDFNGELRSYQKKGYDWLHFLGEYGLGGILADDMGLGKTVQTLAYLSRLKSTGRMDKPALIVAPTSLMSNWRREAQSFTPDLSVLILQGPERHDRFALIGEHDLVLTTYPLLPRDQDRLLNEVFSILILDEAQVVKNPKSQAARVVRRLKTEQRLCLTGTPMENHLGELWTQFDFLMPGFLGDQSSFKRLYRNPIEKHGDGEAQARLARRIAPFMLRRGKDEVEKDLPQKTEIIRSVSLEKNQATLYESIRLAMEKKVRDAIAAKGLARSHITILDALLKLRQVCCDPRLVKLKQAQKIRQSAKLEMLMELLPEMLDEGRRVLLFSQFTSMLGLIQKELDKRKIAYAKLTGQTRKRDQAIERFVAGEADVFLISLKAGGVGLNLTAADTVIFYDPWWNPAVEAQAMDRAHRIGQDKPVFVYKLLTENTVEEKILALQQKKKALAEAVYRQRRQGEKFQLTDTDLQVLFEPLVPTQLQA